MLIMANCFSLFQQPRASQLVSFLQPFKPTLWVLVLVSVKVIHPHYASGPQQTFINCISSAGFILEKIKF